jgi:hypothetical protein
MENLIKQPVFKNLSITLLGLLVAFFAAKTISEIKSISFVGAGTPVTDSITVSGTADVITTPDIATFTFTVQEEAQSVPDAQKKATDKSNAVLAYIKKAGIADNDVKTLSYNIYPRYEYHQNGATINYGGTQVLAAYVVSQTVQVKVRKLDDAGKVLSGIGTSGASDVSGLTFSVDKQKEVERQARDKAIADAREQAESLARSLGVRLGRIVSYNEGGSAYPQPMYYAKVSMMSDSAGVSAPSIPSGENKVTSNVTVTYEIK